MPPAAGVRTSVASRRRRRSTVGVALALLFVLGVAWLLRDRWRPNPDRVTVVADDARPLPDADAGSSPPSFVPTSDEPVPRAVRSGSPASDAGPVERSIADRAGSKAPVVAARPGASPSSLVDVPEEPLPEYRRVDQLTGTLSSVGSDTMNNLMLSFAEGFSEVYPDVRIQIESKGSATAPPALTAGVAELGPMSREMNARELGVFEEKYGYRPTSVKVALDALAIYVHDDNPISNLTLAQADAIFSSTRKRGASSDVTTWGGLGLAGDWADKAIVIYGRNSASGSYGFFKERVLAKGDFKSRVKEQPGSAAVVAGVSADFGGCGYSGIGYMTSGVRAVPIVGEDGGPVAPTATEVRSGRYPISRSFWIYVNRTPGRPLPSPVREFLRYVLSREGRDAVAKDGFTTLSAEMAIAERAKWD